MLLISNIGVAGEVPNCGNILDSYNSEQAADYRSSLIENLRRNGSVASIRVHPDGSEIPIVLVNKDTIKDPVVRDLIARTLGFGMDVDQSRGSTDIDHGYVRFLRLIGGSWLTTVLKST